MLTAREVRDFLQAADIESAVSGDTVAHAVKLVPDDDRAEGELPSKPDRVVAVRIVGGAGELGERTRDQPTVSVTVRGLPSSDEDPQRLASAADDALLGIDRPTTMGATRVISVQRLSGQPAFSDRDDARRSLYSCSYVLQVARTTF